MDSDVLQILGNLFPMIAVIVAVSVGGWVFTTWLRIKNGYPLETSWERRCIRRTAARTASASSC